MRLNLIARLKTSWIMLKVNITYLLDKPVVKKRNICFGAA